MLSLPSGFVEQRLDNSVWWAKAAYVSVLQKAVAQGIDDFVPLDSALYIPHSTTALRGGRGAGRRIPLDSQGAIIVRPYRRGGFVRHFFHDLYWDRPLRPFAELCCTAEARRRSVPTVEVLGARVEWRLGLLYSGLLVTREALGFLDLWTWLQTTPAADLRRKTLSVVAQAIVTMHQAGIAHADLNPTNILVCPDNDPPQALIIDFDRARLFAEPIPSYLQEANLRRFRRFFSKYDALARWMPAADLGYFQQKYRTVLALKK